MTWYGMVTWYWYEWDMVWVFHSMVPYWYGAHIPLWNGYHGGTLEWVTEVGLKLV